MRTLINLIFVIALLSCSEKKSDIEFLSFELRLAQREPDSSLTQMVFYNSNENFFVHDSVYVSNRDIDAAQVIDWDTQPKVRVILNETGTEKFAQFTGKYVGEHAAMIVDNKLMSAPRINAQITQGVLLIVGLFDQEEAQRIAEGVLRKSENLGSTN